MNPCEGDTIDSLFDAMGGLNNIIKELGLDPSMTEQQVKTDLKKRFAMVGVVPRKSDGRMVMRTISGPDIGTWTICDEVEDVEPAAPAEPIKQKRERRINL